MSFKTLSHIGLGLRTDFSGELLERSEEPVDFLSDCLMLLDVNNVYVNSVNHGYDAYQFISNLPSDRIAYIHIAGHDQRAPDLIIDTHGAQVIDPVWDLLRFTYACRGIKPTLLERDSDIPPLDTLLAETRKIHAIQNMEVEA